MMAFRDFRCGRIILSGVETIHVVRGGEMEGRGVNPNHCAFLYALVTYGPHTILEFSCPLNLSRQYSLPTFMVSGSVLA
jgi:hypothetical protein